MNEREDGGYRDPNAARVGGVIDGWRKGWYSLPDDLAAAITERDQVTAMRDALRRAGPVAPSVETVAASLDITDTPDPARIAEPFVEADRLAVEYRHATVVVGARLDQAERSLRSLAVEAADDIVTDHLRPAMGESLDAIWAAAQQFDGTFPPGEAVPHLPKAKGDAWRAGHDAAARYGGVRMAQEMLERLTGSPAKGDTFKLFDPPWHPLIWGEQGWKSRAVTAWRPWPADPMAYAVWVSDPTRREFVVLLRGDEQDQRTDDYHRRNQLRPAGSAFGVHVGGG
jgi:hypothetical protein